MLYRLLRMRRWETVNFKRSRARSSPGTRSSDGTKKGVAIGRAQEYVVNPETPDGGPVPGFVDTVTATLPGPKETSDESTSPPGKVTYQCQECGNKV